MRFKKKPNKKQLLLSHILAFFLNLTSMVNLSTRLYDNRKSTFYQTLWLKRVTFLPDSMTKESHLSTRLYDKRESAFYQTLWQKRVTFLPDSDKRESPFYQTLWQKRVTFLPDSMTKESHLSTRLYDKRESPFYQTLWQKRRLQVCNYKLSALLTHCVGIIKCLLSSSKTI